MLIKRTIKIIFVILVCVILFFVLVRVIVGDRYIDKPTNLSDELNAALRDAPTGNIVDIRILTGNIAWDRLHILLPGTDVSDYVRNFRVTVNVSGESISSSLIWGGEQDTSIENNPELVLLIFSQWYDVTAYANVVQKYSLVPFAEIVRETGKSVFEYSDAVFELDSKN